MKYSPTYERGYRAAVAGQPRKAPASVRKVLPSLSPEWFRGYDKAVQDNEAEQAQTLAGFEALVAEPAAPRLIHQPAEDNGSGLAPRSMPPSK